MEILILDIETTGFLNQGGSIVEIGIVSLDLNTGEIKEVFDSLLKEKCLTDKHKRSPFGWIFRNSDLTVEELRNAPAAEGVFAEVQEILDAYPYGVTAWNNPFDFGFFDSRGLTFKGLPDPMAAAKMHCKILDKRSYIKNPNVEEAFKFFFPNENYNEKHRGLDDAKHEARIIYQLYLEGVFKI